MASGFGELEDVVLIFSDKGQPRLARKLRVSSGHKLPRLIAAIVLTHAPRRIKERSAPPSSCCAPLTNALSAPASVKSLPWRNLRD